MEDTLRVKNLKVKGVNLNVLILVLIEDTLRVGLGFAFANGLSVLILVLMEDTLRGKRNKLLSS